MLGEPGGVPVRVDVAANVWGLRRGQCGVYVVGSDVAVHLGVNLIAA